MKKTISKSLVLIGMALVFAVSLFFGLSANMASPVNAETGFEIGTLNSDIFSVETWGHDNTKFTATEENSSSATKFVNGSSETDNWKSETYAWRDVKYFKLSLNTDDTSFPSATGYTYSYSVCWIPVQIVDNKAVFDTDHTVVKTIYNDSAESKEGIKSEVYFTVDDNTYSTSAPAIVGANALGETYTKNGGWGLYIFSFNTDSVGTIQSQIFQLTPDSVENLSKPIISTKAVSSKESVNDAYIFSVDSTYKYVKRDLIYWSISGTGRDGRSYVLTPQDITNPNTTNSVFPDESVERTGLTFNFDPAIEGTWKAECSIYKDIEHTQRHETAFSEKVSTVQGLSTQSLIWIVVGAGAAAGLIVAIVIIIAIKKEKVY